MNTSILITLYTSRPQSLTNSFYSIKRISLTLVVVETQTSISQLLGRKVFFNIRQTSFNTQFQKLFIQTRKRQLTGRNHISLQLRGFVVCFN